MCLHSRELKAITNNKFERVQDVTLDVVRMHAKKKGVWISTFREVVDQVVNRGFKQVTIDVKDDPKAGWSGLPEQIFETVFAEDSSNHNGGGRSSNNNKHNSKRSCEECVFWGKTDAMLRKFIEFDGGKHKVGYTVANFSRALRDEGYHELSINRPLGSRMVEERINVGRWRGRFRRRRQSVYFRRCPSVHGVHHARFAHRRTASIERGDRNRKLSHERRAARVA